eukprot:Skav209066  [mRNA]  locus=scaffold760:342758:355899:+ [translate_table: standard]
MWSSITSAENLQVPRVENLRGSSRGSQGRSESNHSWAHDFREPIRSVNRREDVFVSKLENKFCQDQLNVAREVAPRELFPAKEEVCGLLVKLFDYCGLTRKENKASAEMLAAQVRRLNSELHALGVFTTDQVEPNQRVPYEAFVQSRRLREAVQNCRPNQENQQEVDLPVTDRLPFNIFVLATTFLNILIIGLEQDFETEENGIIWFIFESLFVILFIIELVIRWASLKRRSTFFQDGWNVCDVIAKS